MYYNDNGPHKDSSTRVCVCVFCDVLATARLMTAGTDSWE